MAESQLMDVAIAASNTIQSGRYVTVAVYALAFYEWLLTLDDEVDLIHSSRWNSVKIAYLCCRYYPIFFWALYLWAFVQNQKLEICRHVVKALYILMIPYQLSSQAVMVIRAWAFTGKTKVTLCVLATAYAILFGVEIWVFSIDVNAIDPSPVTKIIGETGCFRNRGRGLLQTPDKVAITLLAACLVDVVCTSLIGLYCLRLQSVRGPLGKSFVMQSLGAFVTMTGVHVTSAAISFRNSTFAGGVVAPIPMILSNIVACQLILSIRRRVSPTSIVESQERSRLVKEALDLLPTISNDSDEWAAS